MRIKIVATTEKPVNIPYNYQYILHAAIYNLIQKSSNEYSAFLHDIGFIDGEKHIKLFTFSKLFFHHYKSTKAGFSNVMQFTFFFGTPVAKSFENLVLGIFSDQKLSLKLNGKENVFFINSVETLPDIEYSNSMKMKCLSPITMATPKSEEYPNQQHFLDYMNAKERELFVKNLLNNLLLKYKLLNGKEFMGNKDFEFNFDPNYIIRKNGKISKLITFKNNIKIKAMEAPFRVTANPELIKIAYECGFGEKNSAGFGMVDVVE